MRGASDEARRGVAGLRTCAGSCSHASSAPPLTSSTGLSSSSTQSSTLWTYAGRSYRYSRPGSRLVSHITNRVFHDFDLLKLNRGGGV